jgi:nitrogen-specific signal transduction histidine kinase
VETMQRLLPPPLWDVVLRLTPCHVLLFDAALVCRYAAPCGEELAGYPPSGLVGRRLPELFPGCPDFAERAVQALTTGDTHDVLVRCEHGGQIVGWHAWLTRLMADTAPVVLVMMIDETASQDDIAALRAERDQLREREASRREIARDLYTNIRTLLTPISGYLQLMARRPRALAGRDPADLVERELLPAVNHLTELVEQLPAAVAERPSGNARPLRAVPAPRATRRRPARRKTISRAPATQ